MQKELISPNADLRASITSVFAFHKQPVPDAWLQELKPKVNEEIEKAIVEGQIAYQRFLINQHFRQALGRATTDKKIDTTHARWCLIENDTTERWIHHFKDSVSKCIIRNSLCGMVAPETTKVTA